jgi:hypothetical protein
MFDDFVAHNLVSAGSEQRLSSVVLDAGRTLLAQGLSPEGWSTVSPDVDASRFSAFGQRLTREADRNQLGSVEGRTCSPGRCP